MTATESVPPSIAVSEQVALRFAGVAKTFRPGGRLVRALDSVDLSVGHGMVTGLIGPDGAGKTTLMRLAAGLLAPDAGDIEVLGMDVRRDALRVQAAIGYMPQRFGLYEDLTVQENLDLYADLKGVLKPARPDRYRELMGMTGLGPFTQRLAGRLSGGMKQKLGLACTLVRPPRLLLLDEPTVGVDPLSRRELWQIVFRLVQEEGMTVLLSTAYLDEAERCAHVALMHEGRLLAQGNPGELAGSMAGKAFLADAPGVRKRTLQSRLSGLPDILDAVVQGHGVRVVVDTARSDGLLAAPPIPDLRVSPVPPRLEDAFVSLLRQKEPVTHDGPSSAPVPVAGADQTGEPIIRVQDLARRFGTFYAVRDVSFEVRKGEVFGLLGANGAGKSTTFRMLCGLLPPSAGTLRVAGVDLRRAAAQARRRIGYMSQKFSLYGNLSVRQNLAFFSSAYGLAGSRQKDRLDWAMAELELEDMAEAASGDLPLGYKQRLALACALMHEPDILFLDEPTSGVDPLARREFWKRINSLAEAGVTVMVTTHFMEEAEYCDRLAIMASGRILTLGTPEDIRVASRREGEEEPAMEEAFIRLIESRADGASDP